MITPIIIDASEMQEMFNIPDGDIKQFISNIISELAIEFSRYWSKEADVLKSTKSQYKNSIYTNQVNDNTYEVGLLGWLPNAVEQGIEGFDMKKYFMDSNKAIWNIETHNWYLTIPFRHGTSGIVGESEIFSGVMPSEVYKEAKNLGESNKGLDIKKLPKQYQIPKVRPLVVTKSRIFEEYKNKTSIYAGIQRKVDSTGRGNYISFRRVSSNSDENSWIHTGIEAHNFAEKAFDKMNIVNTVDKLAEKYQFV